MIANTIAATRWVGFGLSNLPARLPTTTAIAATDHSARLDAIRIVNHACHLASNPAVPICVRSPPLRNEHDEEDRPERAPEAPGLLGRYCLGVRRLTSPISNAQPPVAARAGSPPRPR